MWCALALCCRLRDYHLSVFWRLLRPEFVRERGTTLLGITTTSSSTTDSSTIATTNAALITAGSTSTTSSSSTSAKTAPATPAEVTVGDTSAVDESDVTLDIADKFKVMNLPQYAMFYAYIEIDSCNTAQGLRALDRCRCEVLAAKLFMYSD
jgi:hypothetical protein